MTANSASVRRFREAYIKKYVGRFYLGCIHYGVELLGVGCSVFVAALYINELSVMELITVPVVLVLANLVEHWSHKNLLHRNSKLTKTFYHEHTVLHHRYFTSSDLEMERMIDLHRILFPPIGTFFFIFFVGVPVACLAYILINLNVALLIFITVVSFFLMYETVHLICHLPDRSRVFWVPGLAFLKRHHKVHHQPELMSRYNFNISFPLMDLILRTKFSG